MVRQKLLSRFMRVIRKPGFWLIVFLFILITVVHYGDALQQPAFIGSITSSIGLTRHAFERILYMAPIVWAGFLFGWRGAFHASLVALACMLPRAIFLSLSPTDAIFETGAVFIVGNVLTFSFESLRKERIYRTQLETTQQELQSNLQVIKEDEKRLAALNQISSTVSQSLELNQILGSAIDSVVEVMQLDVAWIYLLDEESKELILSASHGISEELALGLDRLKVGEGLNGSVAESGESLFVEDISHDSRLTREVVSKYNMHSTLIVPLSSKGKVNGTLCAAMYSFRQFQQEEVELLTAIGNQIGVAVENARLYQQQQEAAEELRVSEERYRELFENAHDAIWLHDFEGNIFAVNKASERMTGYSVEELNGMNVRAFLSEESLKLAGQVRHRLLAGEHVEQPYEQHLIKKDGSEVFIQLATGLVFDKGQTVAFQHIARDVTEERRLKDNLRFYLRQTNKAQEEERKRISHELHDDTIQSLVVLIRQLDMIASGAGGISDEKKQALVEELREQVNSTMQGVRRLSQDLRPAALDRLGLMSALEWLVADVAQYSGVETRLNVTGEQRRLHEEVELVLFRIAQEALRNVWKHSGATRADITVEFKDNETKVTVSDNGKGFDLPDKIGDLARFGKLGLAGMQERAQLIGGDLKVSSRPGEGTSVTVEMPG